MWNGREPRDGDWLVRCSRRGNAQPNAGFKVNSDRGTVDDIVDRLQIRYAIQEDIPLRAKPAIGNVAQAAGEGQCFLRQIEFKDVIEGLGRWFSGTGSAVGVVVLSGRKIVLNPCPVQLPANSESGPRGDGTATAGGVTDGCRTSWIRKSGGPHSRLSRCCLTAM